jgi:hypothetical protein
VFKGLRYSQGEFANYELNGQYMYRQFIIQQFCSLSTLCVCVLCVSEKKQRLFPYTTLTDWFFLQRDSVFTARYGLDV